MSSRMDKAGVPVRPRCGEKAQGVVGQLRITTQRATEKSHLEALWVDHKTDVGVKSNTGMIEKRYVNSHGHDKASFYWTWMELMKFR